MLKVVGRLIKDNELIGYQLYDGKDKFLATVLQLWKTAQQQYVENIEASGTEENPVIKSKEGSDLMLLPTIDYRTV